MVHLRPYSKRGAARGRVFETPNPQTLAYGNTPEDAMARSEVLAPRTLAEQLDDPAKRKAIVPSAPLITLGKRGHESHHRPHCPLAC